MDNLDKLEELEGELVVVVGDVEVELQVEAVVDKSVFF